MRDGSIHLKERVPLCFSVSGDCACVTPWGQWSLAPQIFQEKEIQIFVLGFPSFKYC